MVPQPTLSNGRRRDTIDHSCLQHAHYLLCDLSASCQKWSCLGAPLLPPLLVLGPSHNGMLKLPFNVVVCPGVYCAWCHPPFVPAGHVSCKSEI